MLETIIAILASAPVIGVVAWAIQLGNRVTKVETQFEDISDLLDAKFEPIYQRLDRIERAMNGNLKGHD
jgi:hypothetical protein